MANLLPSKHLVYFEVLEALHDQGCPVCRLGLRAVSRSLDALSYEGVNDPRLRAELRAARGFCRYHAWQFALEVRDGLGTAIVYHDIIGELLHVLAGDDGRELWWEAKRRFARRQRNPVALAARLAPQQACPACRMLAESSRRYLDTLLSHLGDETFRGEYLASAGLCLPHLSMGLRRAVTARQRDLLAQAFARRIAPSAAGRDAGPWADAIVEAMVGKEGATQPRAAKDTAVGQVEGAMGLPLRVVGSVNESDCPVCRSVAPAMDNWLARLAAPSAAAGAQQEDQPPAASLCNAHLWRLRRVVGASRTAAFLQPEVPAISDLLQAQARQIDAAAGWHGLLALLERLGRREAVAGVTAPGERGHCPACEAQAAVERQATLAALGAPRLCLPHLRQALSLPGASEQAMDLTAAQIRALEALRWQLGEYIRKQDYRFRHEPLGAEADAPWRAVAQVAGGKEV